MNINPQNLGALASDVPGLHAGRVIFGLFGEYAGTEEVVVVAEVITQAVEKWRDIAEAIRIYVNRNSTVALRDLHLAG